MEQVTLAEYNALLEHCGCCPAPRCCPPLLECQSGWAVVDFAGFLRPEDVGESDAGSDGMWPMPDRYMTHVLQLTEKSHTITVEDEDVGTYVSRTQTGGGYVRKIWEYASHLDASIAGGYSGKCYEEVHDLAVRCEFGGGCTIQEYGWNWEDGQWVYYLSSIIVRSYSSAEGEERPEHIQWEEDSAAWDAEHPDYENELAAWGSAEAAFQVAYDQYVIDYNAWAANGEVGDPPVEPESPGPPPPPRPEEPEEFFGPCTWKAVRTYSYYYREKVNGAWTSVLAPGLPETTTSYGLLGSGGEWWTNNPLVGPTEVEERYEDPVSHADFQNEAAAWITENIHRIFDAADASGVDSSAAACEPGALCSATRAYSESLTPGDFRGYRSEQFFRYRFKLNKCCGYKRILSAWREVFFPKDYLEWFDSLDDLASGVDPGPPPADLDSLAAKKQWLWEGDPPLCPENDDSVASNDTDPYDHEPMWSPWSLVTRIPDGQRGLLVLRNYLQYCGPALPDLMPDVTVFIDLSDSKPDGPNDGLD